MTITARTIFRVLPGVLGKWELYRGNRQVGRFDDKASAVAEGQRLAQENKPSQLIIHTANREIEDEVICTDDVRPRPD